MRVFPTALALVAALVAGASALLTHPEPASAMTLRLNTANDATQSADTALPVQKVAKRGGGRRGYGRGGGRHYKYHRGRHGPRYRHRHGRYRHYYGGYWYAFPWWLGVVSVPFYDPHYYAPRRPRYSGGSCDYWSGRCSANWSRRRDYLGCLRYHGCL
jgi:hypothetical protein